jgi:hypothetical protein
MVHDPQFISFVAGMVAGAIVGAALRGSPRFRGLALSFAAILILFVVLQRGVPSLEESLAGKVEEFFATEYFGLGAVLGGLLTWASSGSARRRRA